MTPRALVRLFDRYKGRSGIVGVAFGTKEVAGRTDGCPLAVTFFVREKLPVKGARRRLSDGRARLPKFVEFQGSEVATDVVTTDAERIDAGSNRSPPGVYRAGGKISNRQITGTFGCLVRRPGSPVCFALTNRHIALDPGTVLAIPNFGDSDAIAATTTASVGFVADEQFLKLFDAPQSYIDVDCALARIPPVVQHRVSPDIPHYGAPTGIFQPDQRSQAGYVASLIGREVFSYSWRSGPRTGTISHVYYVYQRAPHGMQRIACYTVKSSDAGPPGIPGDSGKLWMTRVNGVNLCAGVHMGVVADNAAASRYAIATEFASLARHLNIDVV